MSTKTKIIAAAALAALTLIAYSADALADKKWVTKSAKWCTDHGFKSPCEVFEITVTEPKEGAKKDVTGNEPKLGAIREGGAPR